MENFVNISLWTGYILVAACTVLAIVLPLINAIDNPKVLVKGAIGTAGLALVFLIGWAIADGTAIGNVSGGVAKFVSGSLITMYVLTIGALAGIVYTEIVKVIK
ncbi:MAG: hypothetical protein NXI20_19195 [bacterium]|nr:hypothetical protein [bacterium]